MSSNEDGVKFYCGKCNAEIVTTYTNEDFDNNEYLDFTCSKCGHSEKTFTKKLVDEANKQALEQAKKYFKIK